MTELAKRDLGKTLWSIADTLRGAMNADDFRDYMLSFLFLRYLSDNYEQAAQKELGADYPKTDTAAPAMAPAPAVAADTGMKMDSAAMKMDTAAAKMDTAAKKMDSAATKKKP